MSEPNGKKPTGVNYVPSLKYINGLLEEIMKCEFIAHHMNKLEQFRGLLESNSRVFENDKTAEGLYAESKGMLRAALDFAGLQLETIGFPIPGADITFNLHNDGVESLKDFLTIAADKFDQGFEKDIEDDAIQHNLIETVQAWLEDAVDRKQAFDKDLEDFRAKIAAAWKYMEMQGQRIMELELKLATKEPRHES